MNKRFWVDTVVAKELGAELLPALERAFADGYVAVTADTAIDIAAFQQNPAWLAEKATDGWLIVEAFYDSFDQMTAKYFVWSSADGKATEKADTFDEAIKSLPNAVDIAVLRDVLDTNMVKKADWIEGRSPWKAPGKLSPEAQAVLNLAEGANRSEVLMAAKLADRMDLFDDFNASYCEGLAKQHDCDYILTVNETLMLI